MPVTFELIEGNGPVYIHGLQVPGNYELESAEGLAGEEEEEDVCIHSHFTCIDCCSTHFILIVNNIFLLFLLQQEDEEDEAKDKAKNAKNAVNKNGKKK